MNFKLALLSMAAFLGLTGVSFAQTLPIGNPFASLGLDFYGFFLPWIFAFAIVFGLLSKTGTFDKKINMALAFVVAFFVSAVGGPQMALFFTSLFGGASMILAGILVILLFAMMVGVKFSGDSKRNTVALIILVIIGIFLFLASSGSLIQVQFIGTDFANMIFWIIVIAAAIYFVTQGGGDEGGGKAPPGGKT